MKTSKVARLARHRAARASSKPALDAARARRLRLEEPYAAASVLSIGLLIVGPGLQLLAFVLAAMSRMGDCFEPACPPEAPSGIGFAVWVLAVIVGIPVLPMLGIRALFGDHPVARALLTVWGLTLAAGTIVFAPEVVGGSGSGLALFGGLGLLGAVCVVGVAALAWLKWWTTRVSRPIA